MDGDGHRPGARRRGRRWSGSTDAAALRSSEAWAAGGGRERCGGVLEVDFPARFLARGARGGVGVARGGRRRRELDGAMQRRGVPRLGERRRQHGGRGTERAEGSAAAEQRCSGASVAEGRAAAEQRCSGTSEEEGRAAAEQPGGRGEGARGR